MQKTHGQGEFHSACGSQSIPTCLLHGKILLRTRYETSRQTWSVHISSERELFLRGWVTIYSPLEAALQTFQVFEQGQALPAFQLRAIDMTGIAVPRQGRIKQKGTLI